MTIPNSAIKYGLGLTYVQDGSGNWRPVKNAWLKSNDGTWTPLKTGWLRHDDGSWERIYPTPKGVFSPNVTTLAHSYYSNYPDPGTVVSIQNTGDFDLTINNISATSETSVITYSNALPSFPITITPGNTANIKVTVGGNAAGYFTGTLSFTNHVGYLGYANVNLSQATTVKPDYADISLVGTAPTLTRYKGDGEVDFGITGYNQLKFTVGSGVSSLVIEAAGAGGGGGGNDSQPGSAGYPGHTVSGTLSVSTGDVIAINVGGGGGAGAGGGESGRNYGAPGAGFIDVTQSAANGSTNVYSVSNGAWSSFMNSHAVWVNSDGVNPVGSWATVIRYVNIASPGTYTFKAQADNSINLSINFNPFLQTSDFSSGSPAAKSITLAAGLVRIQMDVLNGGGPAGFAVQLLDATNTQIWDTRTTLTISTSYNGGRGGYQGGSGYSGSGGGGGAATVITQNGTVVLVAAGGGGGGGGGNYSSGKGQILGANGISTAGAAGVDYGGDGGGGGGGGGGAPGGIGGAIFSGDSGANAGSDGYDLVPSGFTVGRANNAGKTLASGSAGYARVRSLAIDTSAAQTVTILNSGNGATLNISSIASENGYFSAYNLSTNNVTFNFIPGNYYGNTATFSIAPYTTLDLGVYKDNIVITSNSQNNPTYKIPVVINVIEPNGNAVFTQPGVSTFTVPDHVHYINALVVGGGGGGGNGRTDVTAGAGGDGGGGGSGAYGTWEKLKVTPGETITITVGAGGAAGTNGSQSTIAGSFGSRTVNGGLAGNDATVPVYYDNGGADSDGGYTGDSGGGGGGGCFITTATVTALGLPDDCEPLMLARQLRDKTVAPTSSGKRKIALYYSIAPSIVERFDGDWQDIYTRYIDPVTEMVKQNRVEEADRIYTAMCVDLFDRYGLRYQDTEQVELAAEIAGISKKTPYAVKFMLVRTALKFYKWFKT